MKLYPDGENKNYLGVFLELHTTSCLPFKTKLRAKYSLCLVDQINGKHKKFTGISRHLSLLVISASISFFSGEKLRVYHLEYVPSASLNPLTKHH